MSPGENESMTAPVKYQTFSPELVVEFEEVARRIMAGIRDPERMDRAFVRMDRIREEIRQKHGILHIGVPAIRELRDE
jgi:hypothetical protein